MGVTHTDAGRALREGRLSGTAQAIVSINPLGFNDLHTQNCKLIQVWPFIGGIKIRSGELFKPFFSSSLGFLSRTQQRTQIGQSLRQAVSIFRKQGTEP